MQSRVPLLKHLSYKYIIKYYEILKLIINYLKEKKIVKKYNVLIIILLFLFIYEPPLFSINILHILGAVSWLYIVVNIRAIFNIMNGSKIIRVFILFLILFFYLILVATINDNSFISSVSYIYWILDILPACIMFTVYFTRKSYNIYDVLNLILIVGTIQGVIAISSFLIPNVKLFFINRLLDYGYSDVYLVLSEFRMYGFASNLTFSAPITQAVISIISIYLAIDRNWKYILVTPIIVFSAIINARTAFIIFVIGILALVISNRNIKLKKVFKALIICIFMICIITIGLSFLYKKSSATYDWITMGIDEILTFFNGNKSQGKYFEYFTGSDRYVLPKGFGILFGVGERIMGSDIGYINDIWLGGIIYSITSYIIFSSFLLDIFKKNSLNGHVNKFLAVFFLGTLIVSNIKGYVFIMNNLTNLLFLIFTFLALRKNKIQT